MSSGDTLILGIDGGGTKTVAVLSHQAENGTQLGQGSAGPSNARAIGFPDAHRNIKSAIDAAFQVAGLQRTKVATACLSLAGMGRLEDRNSMLAWAIEQEIAHRIEITTDAESILAAASNRRVGIALICGTGSLAWGRNDTGQTERAGGWGFLLGDEGSAYGIAVAGLQAAARSIDLRGPKTVLVERFQNRLQAPAPFDLIERIYNPAMTRDKIAALAEVVFDTAESDAVAAKVLQQGATALADCVICVGHKLGFTTSQYTLGAAGGVILARESYRVAVLASLSEQGYAPRCLELVPRPVLGALLIARQMHLA